MSRVLGPPGRVKKGETLRILVYVSIKKMTDFAFITCLQAYEMTHLNITQCLLAEEVTDIQKALIIKVRKVFFWLNGR